MIRHPVISGATVGDGAEDDTLSSDGGIKIQPPFEDHGLIVAERIADHRIPVV